MLYIFWIICIELKKIFTGTNWLFKVGFLYDITNHMWCRCSRGWWRVSPGLFRSRSDINHSTTRAPKADSGAYQGSSPPGGHKILSCEQMDPLIPWLHVLFLTLFSGTRFLTYFILFMCHLKFSKSCCKRVALFSYCPQIYPHEYALYAPKTLR